MPAAAPRKMAGKVGPPRKLPSDIAYAAPLHRISNASADSDQYRCLLELLITAGLRIGEEGRHDEPAAQDDAEPEQAHLRQASGAQGGLQQDEPGGPARRGVLTARAVHLRRGHGRGRAGRALRSDRAVPSQRCYRPPQVGQGGPCDTSGRGRALTGRPQVGLADAGTPLLDGAEVGGALRGAHASSSLALVGCERGAVGDAQTRKQLSLAFDWRAGDHPAHSQPLEEELGCALPGVLARKLVAGQHGSVFASGGR